MVKEVIYKMGSRKRIEKKRMILTVDELTEFFKEVSYEDILFVRNLCNFGNPVPTKSLVELFILYKVDPKVVLEIHMIPDEKVRCVSMKFSDTSPPKVIFEQKEISIKSDEVDHIHTLNHDKDILYHFDDPVSYNGELRIYSLDSEFECMKSTLKWYAFIEMSKLAGIGGGFNVESPQK